MTDLIRTVKHKVSGASVKVHPYGATVLSYTTTTDSKDGSTTPTTEHLFLSKHAVLDGSKPIRGGIPLVFPIFGSPPDKSTMPQHGFARRNMWNIVKEYDEVASAGMVLELDTKKDNVKDGMGTNNKWSTNEYVCDLKLTVDFNGKHVTVMLQIVNTGKIAFPFQALLHTYYNIHDSQALDAKHCYVLGLDGYKVTDKVTKTQGDDIAQGKDPITITSEVDRVYTPPHNENLEDVTIGVGGNGKKVLMETSAEIDFQPVPLSNVVWNPFVDKSKSMSDFDDEEYKDMICVEPGILAENTMLEPGKKAYLTQAIYISI